jgi:hypothetical protein
MANQHIGKYSVVLLLANVFAAKAATQDLYNKARTGLGHKELAVVANNADSISVNIDEYYKIKRPHTRKSKN